MPAIHRGEKMYSHSRSVLFFFHQTYQWLMDFYPFLHPHTDSPEEKKQT